MSTRMRSIELELFDGVHKQCVSILTHARLAVNCSARRMEELKSLAQKKFTRRFLQYMRSMHKGQNLLKICA